jgi:DNA (cytosine-5)-methyltransferase 1
MSSTDVDSLTKDLSGLKISDPRYLAEQSNGQLRAISLFSGLGGDTLGMHNAGYDVVGYVEKEEYIRTSHEANFPDCHLIGKDITQIPDSDFEKFKDIDMIFAGFPCQGFSAAGKKEENDPRNTLFREFVRAVSIIKPKWFIGENVKGLLSRKTGDDKNYIDVITDEFKMLGYNVTYKVCKAHLYGVPQKRERLIILGTLDHKHALEFPPEQSTIPSIANIVSFGMEGAFAVNKIDYDFDTLPPECIMTDMENKESQIDESVHPYIKLLLRDKEKSYGGKDFKTLISFGSRDSPIHAEIVDVRNPCKTIICTYGRQPRFFVPLKNANGNFIRCLYPSELKQIQGFPKNYKVLGNRIQKITQIGNAVPPPLIEEILNYNLDLEDVRANQKPQPPPKNLPTDIEKLWVYICSLIEKNFDMEAFEKKLKPLDDSTIMEDMIGLIFDNHGITYNTVSSQMPDDFRNIAGTKLKFDVKKTKSNAVILNDSFPKDKRWIIARMGNKTNTESQLVFLTWNQICRYTVYDTSESLNTIFACDLTEDEKQTLENYNTFERDLRKLLAKYKGQEVRFMDGRISCFPRPNISLNITPYVKLCKKKPNPTKRNPTKSNPTKKKYTPKKRNLTKKVPEKKDLLNRQDI